MKIGTIKIDSTGESLTVAVDPDTGAVTLWVKGQPIDMKPSEANELRRDLQTAVQAALK